MSKRIELAESLNSLKKCVENKDPEMAKNGITLDTVEMAEKTLNNFYGDYSKGKVNMREALMSTDSIKLFPKIIDGKLREAAEPEYLGTRFMETIKQDGGNGTVYLIPTVGTLQANEVGEGQRYNEDALDYSTLETSQLEIKVKKYGVKVSITEECISDSNWDILGIHIKAMGRAMARIKEEQIFNNFSKHGHTVYDNNLRSQNPNLGTKGYGKDGSYNDTLSVEDFLDLVLAMMSNDHTPTDVIMHPLTWVVFARNSMIGNGLTYGAFGANNVHPNGAIQGTPAAFGLANNGNGQKFILEPGQVDGRLPVPLTINFSPFVKFDKVGKRFDMYCIDRTGVGCIVEREGLSTDNWIDPERDLRMLKCKERYGIGIYDNGKAITTIKNIAVDSSYPLPPVVTVRTEQA